MANRLAPKKAILFDWRGTLFHDQDDLDWLRESAKAIGRTLSDAEVKRLLAGIEAVPDAVSRSRQRADASATRHREFTLRFFKAAGLDDALAEAVYERDGSPHATIPYSDTREVLCELNKRGRRVAVVSDVHFDLRPLFAHYGLAHFVHAYVLSYQHDFQKPESKAFQIALDQLRVRPEEALMVGDHPAKDGGATAVGIPTLILPAMNSSGERGLSLVLALA